MIAALAYWGFNAADGIGAWLLGIGAPAVAIAVWGAFVAPKARWPVSTTVRLAIEFTLFGAAVLGLVASGLPVLAACLGVAAGATSILNARLALRGDHLIRG
jgi:hypothetical protein